MKYQSLVSSTTPSDLQEWLGQELEDRGIDSVYARSILSLLQQDCIDIEPRECQHFKNRQLKVLQKYGGPESFYSATKSKHQKWKIWGNQLLLTSSSCCKTVISDFERIKKEAAVDCLRSASDYVNDIEELIDEVCIKLKNIKNLKGEKEEIHARNIDQKSLFPFFIPPSSPTDEIKKYFDAFPSLNDKLEKETEVNQQNKNVWCGDCVTKVNHKLCLSNKFNQPIIPYSPLKQIKAIYQNNESAISLDKKEKNSLANSNVNRKKSISKTPATWKINHAEQVELVKQVLSSLKCSWKNLYSFITKAIIVPLEYLNFIQINTSFLHEKKIFDSNNYLKNSAEEYNYFAKTLLKSGFVISNFVDSSNQEKTKTLSNTFIIFQKVVSKTLLNCADFKESVMPLHINKSLLNDSNSCHPQSFHSLCMPNDNEIENAFLESTMHLSEQRSLIHLSSQNNELDRNVIEYIKTGIPKSEVFIFADNQIESIQADFIPNKNKCNEFSMICKKGNDYNFKPNSVQHCGSFGVENQYNPNLFFSDHTKTIMVNDMLYCMYDSPLEDEDLVPYMPEQPSFLPINRDYLMDKYLNKELSVLGENYFYSEEGADANIHVINFKRNGEQPRLKKSLIDDKICLGLNNKEGSQSISFEKAASLIPLSDQMSRDLTIQANLSPSESNVLVEQNKNYVQAADMQHKITKTCGEKWLLYWGDNHNVIAETWQKDFTPCVNAKNFKFSYVSESIIALSKEIKEDGDELLKGLDSIPSINEDPALCYREMPISKENDFYPDSNFNSHTSSSIEYDDEMFENTCSSVIDNSFAINGQPLSTIKSPTTKMLNSQLSQTLLLYENSHNADITDYTDLSAFPNSYESANSMESDYYVEGGGWSFASDSFMDSSFTNPYERSCSLDDLDLKNTEFSEFLYQKRIRCTSESDEDVKQLIRKQNQSQLLKRLKQKFPTRNRPCLFFLQGNCSRTDCKYSHDFSTTTCRFWKEGSCFKGTTCPFLHGYAKEGDNDFYKLEHFLKDEDKDNSYSLESEADFPSLSSTKSEPSKLKSAPINIVPAEEKIKF